MHQRKITGTAGSFDQRAGSSKSQKWSIFKIFQTGGPIEENGAFIGEMHASGQWRELVTYTVRRLDFTFLRAYRSDLKEPFRRAAMLTKLRSP